MKSSPFLIALYLGCIGLISILIFHEIYALSTENTNRHKEFMLRSTEIDNRLERAEIQIEIIKHKLMMRDIISSESDQTDENIRDGLD